MSKLIFDDESARASAIAAMAMQAPAEEPQRPRGAAKAQFGLGDVIDSRYVVQSVIGYGGFGCVYRVHQPLLKKDFALKTLNPIHANETTILRLRKEAQAASKLEHPNLVRAVDFGMLDDVQPYLVMDLVEGRTLAAHLKEKGKIPVEQALELFIPLAQALAYAHDRGVVHRDLKPSNVMLTADPASAGKLMPKIVDFGIAKIQQSDQTNALTLTATGDVFGTPLYMSPEQCAGTGVDVRSDIYSLGCMFFETLTGATPFSGRTALEVMMQHGMAPLPSLKEASMGETFAPELETILARMLAKQPIERYSKAEYVAEDLFWFQHGDFDRLSSVAAHKPQLSKQEIARASAVRTALIAAICTIIGGIVGYGAALSKPPSSSLITRRATDVGDIDALKCGPLQINFESGQFATAKGAEKKFAFRTPDNHPYGRLNWWAASGLKSLPASGTRTVPRDAKIILYAGAEMLVSPQLVGLFKLNDLYGVVIDPNTCTVPDASSSQAIRSFVQQDNLQILQLCDNTMNLRTFRSIGEIPHLIWLDFVRVKIDNEKATGAQVAELKNLQNLHVLRIEKVPNITPVLEKLAAGSVIKRLSLARDSVKARDAELIGKLNSLEVLSLRGCDGSEKSSDLIGQVAKLKHLKTLIVNASVLQATSPESLRKLTGVEIILMRNEEDSASREWAAVMENLKHCYVMDDRELAIVDGNLFDSLKLDPSAMTI